jgi:hypothetical protein
MITTFDEMVNASGSLGGLASALIACRGDIAELRQMSPLQKDTQEFIDEAVNRVGLDRLNLVKRLLELDLTFNLDNPLSVLELYWEKLSESGKAIRTMDPETKGRESISDRKGARIPIYCSLEEFTLGIRPLLASMRSGVSLDSSGIEQKVRRLNESIEDAAISGAGVQVNGNSTPGLLDAPNANNVTYENNLAWDHASKTGENIIKDVLSMAAAAEAVNYYGPYELVVNGPYNNALNDDYKANGDKTVIQRLRELEFGGRNLGVTVSDKMPTNRTSLVQMTKDVIDIVVGFEPTPISWDSGSGMSRHHLILAIMCPRVKDNYDNKSGIVNGNV